MAFPGVSPGDGVDGRYDVVVIGAGPAAGALANLDPDVLRGMRLPSAARRISAGRRAQP
jgi:hypothetical protein